MAKQFELVSEFEPAGDQPTAIKSLVEGINNGEMWQTLLGVTGSGKTFTIANVAQAVQRPMMILAPNKTLAAQLYSEMKEFLFLITTITNLKPTCLLQIPLSIKMLLLTNK